MRLELLETGHWGASSYHKSFIYLQLTPNFLVHAEKLAFAAVHTLSILTFDITWQAQ
jgi:hypothetical protein